MHLLKTKWWTSKDGCDTSSATATGPMTAGLVVAMVTSLVSIYLQNALRLEKMETFKLKPRNLLPPYIYWHTKTTISQMARDIFSCIEFQVDANYCSVLLCDWKLGDNYADKLNKIGQKYIDYNLIYS